MNQTIKQSQAIYQGLRERCTLSTAEFYSKVGRTNPASAPRFQVVPCGNNEFSVVDRKTDQTKAVCTGIDKAVRFAKRRDEAPVAVQARRPTKKPADFATWMLRWICIVAFCMGMFAFFGAHP
ncbi:hypothetical protein [Pseudomonas syringae group sp. J309-1]|uniref:hypothetical protein n=1 Tax=Pseudomonas syringae group sp. J309-1 TaxID=3079588 RepID=UPI0029098481|nr:hypothetical protein [Pseudomonas syringae group sp. J309-1]MDU8358020.1 hypothetical protein [Pseudomonas syringae group sp. J309-1]